MTRSRPLASLLLAFSLLSGAPDARAADDDKIAARESFNAGDAAFKRHDYRAAALAYETAYRLSPNGTAAFNAALAWRAASEREREADALALALSTSGLPDAKAGDSRKRLAELERALGVLEVEAPAGSRVTVRHVERREPPVRVHVPPGEQEVVVETAAGRREVRRVQVTAGETARVAMSAAPIATVSATSTAASGPPPDTGSTQRAIGWIGLGVGVAAGIAAGATGIATLGAYSRANETQTDADIAAFHTLRDTANGLAIGAGAAGVVGLVVLLTAPRAPAAPAKSAAAGVRVCAAPGGLSVCGRF